MTSHDNVNLQHIQLRIAKSGMSMSKQELLGSVLESWGCREVSPMALYSKMFRIGEGLIQQRNEPPGEFKTNPIIVGGVAGRTFTRIMFEDEFEKLLSEFQEYDWAILSGLTYWGKKNLSANQSKMYAMIFDLDGVTPETLGNFMDGAANEIYPLPNYIALSGNNAHLYYLFEDPISLYPNIKSQLKELKFALTNTIWNHETSTLTHRQYQGINQGYRIIGGKTKIKSRRVRAFEFSSHPISLDYLNDYVPSDKAIDTSKLYRDSKVSLEEAKELWPEWYERRILKNEPPGTWKVDRHLYDWWRTKIFSKAEYGHRYFCVMALAIFAVKCGVDEEEARKDARSFSRMLNGLNPDDPFTEADIDSAFDCYDERYITFPRKDIERLTGIPIPPNKRNGRSRWEHLQSDYIEVNGAMVENPCKKNREEALKIARANGDVKGRPKGSGTKRAEVEEFYAQHPGISVRTASKMLGISPTTVDKWRPKQ